MSVKWLRKALYFGVRMATGSRIPWIWREFLSWERLSPQDLEQAIEKKLSHTLEFAAAHSKYYRRLNLTRNPDQSARQWLKQFPILTRPQVREHFSALLTDSMHNQIPSAQTPSPAGYQWVIMKTGGTTGTPTSVVLDVHGRDWGWVTWLYALKLSKFPIGTPFFRLWGSEQDLLRQRVHLPQRILKAIRGEVSLNAFRAREEDLRHHLEIMLSHPKIKHMMTYVDAAASLAMFIQEKKLPRPKLDSIQACAGTVTPSYRKLLEETFDAEVFNKYGSRECLDMACECSQHTGLHVFSPHVFIEIVNESGEACPPGQPGKMLITCLNHLAFPLIRYDIGDVGVWAEHGYCACGSPFPRLQSILGRQDDMLITADGTLQSPSFVRHFVGVSLNWQLIREWQLEQTGPLKFIFRFVPLKTEGLEENLFKLQDSFRLVFGSAAVVETKRVDEIPAASSGKMRWIINNYSPKQEKPHGA